MPEIDGKDVKVVNTIKTWNDGNCVNVKMVDGQVYRLGAEQIKIMMHNFKFKTLQPRGKRTRLVSPVPWYEG